MYHRVTDRSQGENDVALTAPQIALRRSGIASSDIAVVAGVSPYKDSRPIHLYCDKLGLSEQRVTTPEMESGNWLEEPIAQRCAAERGYDRIVHPREFWPNSVDGTLIHPDYAWIMATPDRVAFKSGKCVALIECKNVGIHFAHQWGEDGGTGIPQHVRCQVNWQMFVSGIYVTDVAVLIGGNDFRKYRIEYDEELVELLLDLAEQFWFEQVQRGIPPVESAEDAIEYMRRRYRQADLEPLAAPDGTEPIVEKYVRLEAEIDRLIAERDLLKGRLQGLMGRASAIIGRFGKISWGNRAGKISWKDAAKHFSEIAGLDKEDLAGSVEQFRGKAGREFRPSWNRDYLTELGINLTEKKEEE